MQGNARPHVTYIRNLLEINQGFWFTCEFRSNRTTPIRTVSYRQRVQTRFFRELFSMYAFLLNLAASAIPTTLGTVSKKHITEVCSPSGSFRRSCAANSDLRVEIFEVMTSLERSNSYGEARGVIADAFLRRHSKEGEKKSSEAEQGMVECIFPRMCWESTSREFWWKYLSEESVGPLEQVRPVLAWSDNPSWEVTVRGSWKSGDESLDVTSSPESTGMWSHRIPLRKLFNRLRSAH